MQMGVRWRAGEQPHSSVPSVLHAEIYAQEATHPNAQAWTLTWLEGRPRCDLDGRVVVRLTASGAVIAEAPFQVFEGGDETGEIDSDIPGDDDDDWLK